MTEFHSVNLVILHSLELAEGGNLFGFEINILYLYRIKYLFLRLCLRPCLI